MIIECTPRGLMAVIFRQYKKAVLGFLAVMLLGAAYLALTPSVYLAHGSLLIKFGQKAVPDITAGNINRQTEISSNERAEITQANIDILLSRNLLQDVVMQVGVDKLYPHKKSTQADMENAITRLQKNDLDISSNSKSNLIYIKFMHEDPQLAAEFVKTLMNTFIVKQSEVYNNPQTEFLTQQVSNIAAQLDSVKKEFQDFKSETGVSSLDDEMDHLLREKGDLTSIAFESVTDAQKTLAELQNKRAEMLATYREDSPIIKRLNQSINQAQRTVNERQESMVLSEDGGGTLSSQIQTINDRIAFLEEHRARYNSLAEKVALAEQNYKSYQIKLEEARANTVLNDEKITRVTIVDAPTVPQTPDRPRKKIVLATTILAALLLAGAIALGLELLDDRFTSTYQVSSALRLPVLASFNEHKARGNNNAK